MRVVHLGSGRTFQACEVSLRRSAQKVRSQRDLEMQEINLVTIEKGPQSLKGLPGVSRALTVLPATV